MEHTFFKNNTVEIKPEKLVSEYDNRRLIDQIEEFILDGYNNIIVDLAALGYMNSSGFSFLITVLTKSRNVGGETIIINVSEHVSKLLIMMKLKNVFTICNSREEAMDFFEKQTQV